MISHIFFVRAVDEVKILGATRTTKQVISHVPRQLRQVV